MRYFGEEKPSLDELAHYGVKGMKWGIRKSQHSGYSDERVAADRKAFGDAGVRKINNRLAQGRTYEQARRTQRRRQIAGNAVATAALTAYGALVARNILIIAGPHLAANIASRAATNRGRAAVIGLEASNILRPRARGGVFNVTSLR